MRARDDAALPCDDGQFAAGSSRDQTDARPIALMPQILREPLARLRSDMGGEMVVPL